MIIIITDACLRLERVKTVVLRIGDVQPVRQHTACCTPRSNSLERKLTTDTNVHCTVVEFGETIKNPAYRIPQTEYSGCLDISAHA